MIRIKGIDYRLSTYRLPKEAAHLLDHDVVELGRVDHLSAEIHVCDEINAQLQEETILHEIVHVITRDNSFIQEESVAKISEDLYAVLRDNDLIKSGWMEKLIDEEEESGGELDVIDSVRELDRTTKERIPR